MRLGGPMFKDCSEPAVWIALHQAKGYRAAYCPLDHTASDAFVSSYADAAQRAGIIVAEVGAWCNPMQPDETARRDAVSYIQAQLDLADRIGARCCVNISGSRGEQWDGPDPLNLTQETFDLIVETVRGVLDAVQPRRSYYTLETMPWMYPDGPDSYLELIRAIDRPRFAVHLDPANLVCSPQRYYGNAALLRECFAKLGPHIRSCHAKDIVLLPRMTTHLDEVRPGMGGLDYRVFMEELAKLDSDTSIMMEHLSSEEEYDLAAQYIRAHAPASAL